MKLYVLDVAEFECHIYKIQNGESDMEAKHYIFCHFFHLESSNFQFNSLLNMEKHVLDDAEIDSDSKLAKFEMTEPMWRLNIMNSWFLIKKQLIFT